MFASHHIAKGFAAALMLIPIGSAPALAQASSAAPIEYLQYDLTPYFDLMVRSSQAYQDWQPNSGIESRVNRSTAACSTMRQMRSSRRHRWWRLPPYRTLYRTSGMT